MSASAGRLPDDRVHRVPVRLRGAWSSHHGALWELRVLPRPAVTRRHVFAASQDRQIQNPKHRCKSLCVSLIAYATWIWWLQMLKVKPCSFIRKLGSLYTNAGRKHILTMDVGVVDLQWHGCAGHDAYNSWWRRLDVRLRFVRFKGKKTIGTLRYNWPPMRRRHTSSVPSCRYDSLTIVTHRIQRQADRCVCEQNNSRSH